MTTKYPMPKPHVYHDLMVAKADGAVILYLNPNNRLMTNPPQQTKFKIDNFPQWHPSFLYIIDPKCDYALTKIAELGGDDMVELYLCWLDGGATEDEDGLLRGESA